MFKSPRKITDAAIRRDKYLNFLARSIVCLGVIAVGNSFALAPLIAAPTPATTLNPSTGVYEPTTIQNQATGSFTDGEDPVATPELIVSNIVKVTVAEVAGITVGPGTASEAPGTVANPGTLQGDGTINTGDIAYFDYVITNAGNDPTQFFIPGAPSSIVGGTFDVTTNPIQIIGYNLTGSNPIDISTTPVSVPTAGSRTGPTTATGTNGLLGKNGIIPAGGTVTIRVPIKVTAGVGGTVSATVGKTPAPLGTNQVYTNDSNLDIYTQDNPDGTTDAAGTIIETIGTPVNGDTTNHRQESSNTGSTTVLIEPINITGTIFEDVNYGGGAGRDLTTATGIVRPNVRVELYAADGTYLGATLTDATGKYKFNQFNATTALTASKSYQVRVVNSFVTSSRTGGCVSTTATLTTPPTSCTQIPVQTFRTLGDANTDNIADADINRVGGEVPAKLDADSNLTSQNLSALTVGTKAVESLTTVSLGTVALSGVDFGYNFDSIVNTNDSGQGSLRQFITNSNALANTGLAQVGQTAGKEVSIFMIPSGSASPLPGLRSGLTTQFTGNVAIIKSLTTLPTITDTNTSIDGTTQTTYVGNTNAQTFGYVGKVGTGADGIAGNADDPNLAGVAAPEVEIIGLKTANNALNISGNDFTLRSVSVHGSSAGSTEGAVLFTGSSGFTVDKVYVGFSAAQFVAPPVSESNGHNGIEVRSSSSNISIKNSIVAYNGVSGIVLDNATYSNVTISGNESAFNGVLDGSSKQQADGISVKDITGASISQNYLHDNSAYGLQSNSSTNQTFSNNTVENNGLLNTEKSGIALWRATGDTISHNLIHGNKGDGIFLGKHPFDNTPLSTKITISQNSIYDNGQIGINLIGPNEPTDYAPGSQLPVTPNDGGRGSTFANNGMDYPIMTAASVSVSGATSTLTVKGYVGNTATGSTTFANATLEFFVGAADTNDKGRVFSTDPASVSKLHAEGQTYLGTCTADANGLFGTTTANACSFTVPTGTDPKKLTATATDTTGNTSEFSAPLASDPNVLLVKRITAINGSPNKFGGGSLSGYEDTSSPYDDNSNSLPNAVAPQQKTTDKWPTPSGFLLGSVDGGNAKPNDSIEYTIYFLSTGEAEAKNVLFCDRVPGNVTFNPYGYNSLPTTSGLTDRGIAVNIGGILKGYSNSADGDFAQYFPPGIEPSTLYPNISCGKNAGGQPLPNDNGAVVVNLGNIPQATSSGLPPESYGFVRFQGIVK